MNATQLRAFLVVAETASFSRAAEELHLTQPAVSKRIAQLEDELDTRLLDRIGRQVSLTEAGRALLPRARHILSEMEDSQRAIQNLAGEVAGQLRLGTSHHVGQHHLPTILRNYSARYPQVELDLHFLDSETACAEVSQGDLELAVITLPTTPPAELVAVPIWNDPLCFVCGQAHALAHVKQIAAKDLVRHPALLPARQTTTREILERSFAPLGAHIKTSLSTNYLETLKTMASIGLGWSLLPRTLVDDSLHEFKVRGVQLKRKLGVVHHRTRTLSNAAREIITLLQHADR